MSLDPVVDLSLRDNDFKFAETRSRRRMAQRFPEPFGMQANDQRDWARRSSCANLPHVRLHDGGIEPRVIRHRAGVEEQRVLPGPLTRVAVRDRKEVIQREGISGLHDHEAPFVVALVGDRHSLLKGPQSADIRLMHITDRSKLPSQQRGFSITQVVIGVAVIGAMAAVAVPMMKSRVGSMRSFAAVQDVVGQIRSARVTAMTTNTSMQVRFNCPSIGQYRVVEAIAGGADDPSRCSAPAPDTSPGAPSSNDGPLMRLPAGTKFGDAQDLVFLPSGDMTSSGSAPARIEIVEENGSNLRQIVVTAAGNVELPEPPK